jgi:tRNA-splicing ligase RtcB
LRVIAGHRVPIKAWVDGVELEPKAEQQLENTAALPFVYKHLAVMPDCHWGMGATVGSVLATERAIIPAAVGVDIGCGMLARRLPGVKLDAVYEARKTIRGAIERAVPHGRTDQGGRSDRGAWSSAPDISRRLWARRKLDVGHARIAEKHPRVSGWGDPLRHLGTLGTGNHFVEICGDEEDRVWVMLHSGSRGIGNRIGTHFIDLARRECERWHVPLPDVNLAYLPEGTEHHDDYVEAVGWAQDYARLNREVMLTLTLGALSGAMGGDFGRIDGETVVDCHHNYVTREHHFGRNVFVTRKGAVRAREGDLGIIPGSMGARSYIVEGLGNPESFHSCSHGAGRRMSRGAARKAFTVEDHIRATAGVECRKDAGVLDETPGAYKDIDAVMEAQSDLVQIRHTLKALICVKG